jgi:hypothetical protein
MVSNFGDLINLELETNYILQKLIWVFVTQGVTQSLWNLNLI